MFSNATRVGEGLEMANCVAPVGADAYIDRLTKQVSAPKAEAVPRATFPELVGRSKGLCPEPVVC